MKLRVVWALAVATFPLCAQIAIPAKDSDIRPRNVTYCELAGDPAAFNHKSVRLTAFVTHGFEDFHLVDPGCDAQGVSVWVMYGGNAQSDTAYCCPGEAASGTRPAPLTIEGMQLPLLEDRIFKGFTDLLKRETSTTVRLTAIGTFFSGTKQTLNGTTSWGGAGHLGCCSLFVIQRVESFEPHSRKDVDYTSEAGWYEKEGCEYDRLGYLKHLSAGSPKREAEPAIAEQHTADSGEADWRFTDPQRVAMESLKHLYPDQTPVLQAVTSTPTRCVFHWTRGKERVIVVVTRPYWLSFSAKSTRVVWVSTAIKEVLCS